MTDRALGKWRDDRDVPRDVYAEVKFVKATQLICQLYCNSITVEI